MSNQHAQITDPATALDALFTGASAASHSASNSGASLWEAESADEVVYLPTLN